MPNIMAHTGGNAVRMFGPRAPFPRKGAWVKLDNGELGIIYDIVTERTIDSSNPDGEPIVKREAHVHVIDENRETKMVLVGNKAVTQTLVIPTDALVKATYDDIKQHLHPTDIPPFAAGMMGYELSSATLKSMTALERARLGKSFDDADKAQAAIEESQEKLAQLQRERIAQDPDAIALEEQIEQERVAFIASAAQRREAMHQQIVQKLGL